MLHLYAYLGTQWKDNTIASYSCQYVHIKLFELLKFRVLWLKEDQIQISYVKFFGIQCSSSLCPYPIHASSRCIFVSVNPFLIVSFSESHSIFLPLISHIAIPCFPSWSQLLNMSVVALGMTVSLKGLKEKALTDISQISFFSRQELLSVLLALDILFQSLRQRNQKPQIKVLWRDTHAHKHPHLQTRRCKTWELVLWAFSDGQKDDKYWENPVTLVMLNKTLILGCWSLNFKIYWVRNRDLAATMFKHIELESVIFVSYFHLKIMKMFISFALCFKLLCCV